jgi:biofilm PGA synthesis N-glycosyltransferase PgaC
VLHMRPMGAHDGALRAFRRWGACAYGYGEHPLHVLLESVWRMKDEPVLLGGTSYLAGWLLAAVRRAPRAEPELRAHVRRDQLRRIGRRLTRSAGG